MNTNNTDTPRTATQAQIDANRENARKSTGPRTPEGKAASSRNGLKHGLCAGKHILPGENPDDFLLLLQDLLDRFRPEGPGEETLVLRIAASQWRLDRAFPIEAGIYRDTFYEVAQKDKVRRRQYASEVKYAADYGDPMPPPLTPPDEGDILARAFNVDCAGPNSLAKLARYESAIERSIDRCLRQLKAFQAARNTPNAGPQPDAGPVAESPELYENKPQTASEPAPVPPSKADYEANPNHGSGAPASPIFLSPSPCHQPPPASSHRPPALPALPL